MNSNEKFFSRDNNFWDNYVKGRPTVPDSFFQRIFGYHEAKGAPFGTIHDIGAGNGVHAQKLRSRFDHVIVSDIVPENVQLARDRLAGCDGFSYRAAELTKVDDIAPGSIDMVFAANMMHFADPQDAAMMAIAYQLRCGGTFAAALFGPARFHDPKLQDLWARISYEGGRQVLQAAVDPAQTVRVMARTQDTYNVAPLDPLLFATGAQRLHLNMGLGGIQGMLPPEAASQNVEPSYTGSADIEVHEVDDDWNFEMDLDSVMEHFGSFPFISQFPDAFMELFQELDNLAASAPFTGYYPVKIILATRL